jgi:uncharacterized protein (TIGR00251 family)
MPLLISEKEGTCTFRVHVQPRSRRDEIAGLHGDALKIRTVAPPTGGRANRALQKLLARRLGVPPSSVEILSGHTSRQKRVRVTGVTARAVRALMDKE